MTVLMITAPLIADGSTSASLITTGGCEEVGSGIERTSDGGFITAGWILYSDPGHHADARIRKFRADGEIEWQRTLGSSGLDFFRVCKQVQDGGYVAAGNTHYDGSRQIDAWLVKFDPKGKVLWQIAVGSQGDESANDIDVLPDGSIVASGATDSFGGNLDVLVFRVDPGGKLLWSRVFGAYGPGFSVRVTSDGDIVVCASAFSRGINDANDLWVAKLDESGNVLWQRSYGDAGAQRFWEWANTIVELSNKTIVIGGGRAVLGSSKSYAILLALKQNGDVLWTRAYYSGSGESASDEVIDVMPLRDGGLMVLSGRYSASHAGAESWILRAGPDGEIIWQVLAGQSMHDILLTDLNETADGGVIAYGFTWTRDEGSRRALLLRMPLSGPVDDSCPSLLHPAAGSIREAEMRVRTPWSEVSSPAFTVKRTRATFKKRLTTIENGCSETQM